MLKTLILIILVLFLLIMFANYTSEPEAVVQITLNGEPLELEKPALFKEGTVIIPVKPVYEALGVDVSWTMENKVLSGIIGDFRIDLPIDSDVVTVGGRAERWDVPVRLFNDTVYTPALYSAQALGAFAEWDHLTGTFAISTLPEFDPEPDPEQEGPILNVAYPPGSPTYYYAESLFVFGTTGSYARVEVTVNGEPVDKHDPRTGNFLTMVDLPRGEEFLIRVEASGAEGTSTIERTVIYPEAWQEMPPEPLDIHTTRLIPAENQILSPGEALLVAAQGSPGASAYFQVGWEGRPIAMTELTSPAGPPGEGGMYSGTYIVQKEDAPASGVSYSRPVTVTLTKEGRQVSRKVPGSVSFTAGTPYRIVEVKEEAKLEWSGWIRLVNPGDFDLLADTYGGTGYPTTVTGYLVEGTRFEAVGASGHFYRIKHGGDNTYLIHRGAVSEIGRSGFLHTTVSRIELRENSKKVKIRLNTKERIPIMVNDSKRGVELRLCGLEIDEALSVPELTESVNILKLEPIAGQSSYCAVLSVELDKNITGFDCSWDNTELVLELYLPPDVNPGHPLEGKTILIDPGHGGIDTGAPGPGDIHEKDAALTMSLLLRDLLEEEGAEVIMTRSEDIFIELYARTEGLADLGVDLFISVHCNAHPHGSNAVDTHGLMTLYNYAHNEILAEIMLDMLKEKMELPAIRTWRRNIAVLRHSQVPSVLVEAGYMMHPEDNWHILHPEGQKRFAEAMKEGVKKYFLSLLEQ